MLTTAATSPYRVAALEVADALRDEQPAAPDLASGSAGLAVAFDRFELQWPGHGFGELADAHLAEALRGLARERLGASLYRGIAGIAWTVQRLHERAGAERLAFLEEQVDPLLLRYLSASPWRGDYDLVSGLSGIGVYALERLDAPSGAALLEAVVQRLGEAVSETDAGLAWHTRPELLPEWQREQNPDGYFNLGLAHGAAGPIALLGAACANGVAQDTAGPLLEGAVEWLLAQDDGVAYTHWIGTGPRTHTGVRSVWCYGDPGVATGLLLAARGAGRPDWEERALAIARRAAERDVETATVRDTPLCHGTASLAQIFGRFHAATGDTACASAAASWLERTLALRDPDHGVGGFPYRAPDEAGEWVPTSVAGLLEGAAGVALALLAAGAPAEETWDRFMLLSAPGLP